MTTTNPTTTIVKQSKFELLKAKLHSAEKELSVPDQFCDQLKKKQKKIARIRKQMAVIQQEYRAAYDKFRTMCDYYGEDSIEAEEAEARLDAASIPYFGR